jgi:hypothetical protein
MNIFSLIGEIFAPAAKLVDDLHTSTEEKLALKNKFASIENQLMSKVIDYETRLLASKTEIITAEAQGQSWMQRNWRPITMLTFLVLVVCDSFGLIAFRLADEAWTLLQIGLGGYVVGRSAEKMVDKFKNKTP